MLQCSVLCNFPSLFFCSIFQKISSCILQILLLRFSHLVVEFQFPPVSSFPEYLFKPLSVLTVVTSFLISLRIIICCCSVAKLCLTLLNPMDCSTWGFPVLHYLLEFAQIHVHSVSDAIQPSHLCPPLLLPPSVFQQDLTRLAILHLTSTVACFFLSDFLISFVILSSLIW